MGGPSSHITSTPARRLRTSARLDRATMVIENTVRMVSIVDEAAAPSVVSALTCEAVVEPGAIDQPGRHHAVSVQTDEADREEDAGHTTAAGRSEKVSS